MIFSPDKLSSTVSFQSSVTDREVGEAWSRISATSRAVYQARATADEDRFSKETVTYGARIPLSPSVHASDGESESEETGDASRNERITENKRRRTEQRWARYRLDHSKACGGSLNSVPAKPFNFLGLPVEIRDRIYEMVLKREVAVKPDLNDPKGPIDVRIFAVSRQVYTEATEVFYRVNTFAVRIKDWNLPTFVLESAGKRVHHSVKLIRKMHIWIFFRWVIEDRRILNIFKALAAMLSRCENLTDLKITSATALPRHNPNQVQNFGSWLECFAVVRGVKNVRFTDQVDLDELFKMDNFMQYVAVGTEEQELRMKRIMESSKGE